MIEQVTKANYPGAKVQRFPSGSIAGGEIQIDPTADEGTFIIEDENRKLFFIKGGKPVQIY